MPDPVPTTPAAVPRTRPATTPFRLAIVAPTLAILGGHAIQAQAMLEGWREAPEVDARLVPINPSPPGVLRRGLEVAYLRTALTQMMYWPLLVRELRCADVVHVFSASYWSFLLAPLPAILVARLLGRPVVLNYHSGEAPDHLRRSAVARQVLARVDRLAVPSPFLREVFAGFGLDAAVIPNAVDLDRFAFRQRRPLAPRLLSTRNFEPLYDVACTLRAFRLVQDRYPEASLTLVGSGSQDHRLRELARELNLRLVTFAGQVAPEHMPRYYSGADIYLQTPKIDNMPISVLEAFASGLPVVSTSAGGVPAILTDGVHGLLAPPGDHRAVAAQVCRLLEDPALGTRLAGTARGTCGRYTWAAVRGQWLELYREVLARRVRRRAGRPRLAWRTGAPVAAARPHGVRERASR